MAKLVFRTDFIVPSFDIAHSYTASPLRFALLALACKLTVRGLGP
jgi:hypothetical protein